MNAAEHPLNFSLSEYDQMSWLKSGKGLKATAKKAWKILTNKIHCKIVHKLTRSKARGKRKRRSIKRNSSSSSSTGAVRIVRSHQLQKRSIPVYIDELFIETSNIVAKVDHGFRLPSNDDIVMPGQSSNNKDVRVEADEMWESLALASPQMYGINERADAFIARFRAQMKDDEMKIVDSLRL